MGHLEIPYNLLLIMIAEGAALSLVGFWGSWMEESNLFASVIVGGND